MNEAREIWNEGGGRRKRGLRVGGSCRSLAYEKLFPRGGRKLCRVYLPFANDKVNAIGEYAPLL